MLKSPFIFIFSIIVLVEACPYQIVESRDPFLISRDSLNKNKELIKENDELRTAALEVLLAKAQEILDREPLSVTSKEEIPKGASRNDYVSLAPYWWPDPNKKDGLPFIQRDGRMNPLRSSYPDASALSSLGAQLRLLGLAYFYSGNEKYAEQASNLLKVFFIDKETKMNPHFEFSQIIMGRESGGNIIDANPLMSVADGIQLIKGSPSWTTNDHMEVQKWFKSFLTWMLNSDKGKFEASRKNNIATFYTTQATVYALLIGNKELAQEIIEARAYKNIEEQIAVDGSMPLELKRADPWNYVSYNLGVFYDLMMVARHVGVDLWDYKTETSGSIKQAFDWVESFSEPEKNSFNFHGHYVQMSNMRKFLSKNPRPDDRSRTGQRNMSGRSLSLDNDREMVTDNFLEILTK